MNPEKLRGSTPDSRQLAENRAAIMAEFTVLLAAKQTEAEQPAQQDPIAEELARSGWGTEKYPVEDLRLRAQEQRLVDMSELPVAQVARIDHQAYDKVSNTYRLIHAKEQALMAAETGRLFDDLDMWTQRVIILTGIFGRKWMSRDVGMIREEPEEVVRATRELEGAFGDAWKHWPSLARMDPKLRDELIETYDAEFGAGWRTYPGVLALSPGVVQERMQIYDAWLGEEWRERPGLLKTPPRTVISSIRALAAIGITQENTGPGVYTALISTSMANKRNKIALVRRNILRHETVHASSEKRSLADNVAAGAQIDKDKEKTEIQELKDFLPRFTPSRLMNSESNIKTWAAKQPDLNTND